MLTVKESEKDLIRRLFPKISQISDPEIQEKVIEVWVRLWRQSGLKSIEGTPADRDEVFTLVKHTNVTAELSLAMAKTIAKEYSLSINFDNLQAIAFLHDADLLILREKRGEMIQASELEARIPHGIYGGHIALEVGLSPEIAHGIICHRPTMEPTTVEAIIVKYCDNANYFVYAVASGWLKKA
jgi:hypothetical protein